MPLMIPKPEFFDAVGGEKSGTHFVVPPLLGEPVMRPVQFNRKFCDGTIEV